MDKSYGIRLAEERDLPFLSELEMRASGVIPDDVLPRWLRGQTLETDDLVRALRNRSLWVAERKRELVGFALALPLGGVALLYEVNVAPEEMRHGLGSALVEAVARRAAERGHRRLWVTVFGNIPWELTFYRRAGFVPEEDEDGIPMPIQILLEEENRSGLMHRLAMYRDLPPAARARDEARPRPPEGPGRAR